jgi:ribosome-associated protein
MVSNSETSSSDVIPARPSKGALKRDMQKLQVLGQSLLELPEGHFKRMELPEKLAAALMEAKKLTVHGARRRQLQYIGRIMEEFDVDKISRKIATISHVPKKKILEDQTPKHSKLDLNKLILSSDTLLHEVLGAKLDREEIQALRNSLRQAKKQLKLGTNVDAVKKDLWDRLERQNLLAALKIEAPPASR